MKAASSTRKSTDMRSDLKIHEDLGKKPAPALAFWSRLPLKFKVSIAVLVMAVMGAIVFFSIGKGKVDTKNSQTPPPVLTVTLAPASLATVHEEIKATGSITAWDPLAIAAEVNGLKIEEVLVEEGDHVRRGQLLARLNSAILAAELDREKAQLGAYLAGLNKAIQPNRREDINAFRAVVAQAKATVHQSRAQLLQAQASLVEARSNAKRYGELLSQGAVSAQEAENRSTLAKVAAAEVSNAEQRVSASEFALKQTEERLTMAESGGRLEDISMAKADVLRTQANIRRLEAQIHQTQIKAPTDGLVLKRLAHLGDTSNTGETLFELVRDHRLELRATVPEKDLVEIKPGMPVRVISPITSGKYIKGRLREISPAVDPELRQGLLRIDLPENSPFRPGMFAEARIDLGDYQALCVPTAAILNKNSRQTVFVYENGKVSERSVVVGVRADKLTEIRSGLKQSDLVVKDGAGFLKDGDYVTVGH